MEYGELKVGEGTLIKSRVHLDETLPLVPQCSECLRRISRGDSMKRHMKKVHPKCHRMKVHPKRHE
jgi:hypothetical protein